MNGCIVSQLEVQYFKNVADFYTGSEPFRTWSVSTVWLFMTVFIYFYTEEQLQYFLSADDR